MNKHEYNPHCKCFKCAAYEQYLIAVARKQKKQPYYHPTVPQTPMAKATFQTAAK